jgi:FMN phosphatase YigB (HAD superfamily)
MFNFLRHQPPTRSLDLAPVQAALFDLDGTLIDVDMQLFVPAYLRRLAERLEPYAEPRRTLRALHAAVMTMLDGTSGDCSLEELLRGRLADELQIPWAGYQSGLADFCREDLPALRPLVHPHPLARSLVEACLARGWRVVLATNPIFPREVIDARLDWGGLRDLPFQPVTSYETSRHCKPHAGFFRDLLDKLGLPPKACLMVGNDTLHDLAAGRFGLSTCLLTTWRIDRDGAAYAADWEGTHQSLLDQLQAPLHPSPHD